MPKVDLKFDIYIRVKKLGMLLYSMTYAGEFNDPETVKALFIANNPEYAKDDADEVYVCPRTY